MMVDFGVDPFFTFVHIQKTTTMVKVKDGHWMAMPKSEISLKKASNEMSVTSSEMSVNK